VFVTRSRRSDPEASPRGGGPGGGSRLRALDGLRFLAAFTVLGYHFTAHGHDNWGPEPSVVFPSLSQVTAYGALGPDLFFVISGFVILMTAWGRDLPGYVASRIARLFPAYWAAVVLTSLLLFVLWPGKKDLTPLDAVVNLTMVQKIFSVPHVDGVYWTLWVEFRFYLLIGVLSVLGITRQRIIAFAALWPIVGKLAMRYDAPLLHQLLITEYAPLFAGGMLLYLIYREGHSLLPWLLVGGNAILAVQSLMASQVSSLTKDTGVAVSPLVIALLLFGCFGAVAVVTMTPVSRVGWRWLTTVGALTYPLYLLHEYWGWWVIARLHPVLGPYPTLLLAVAVALAMACAVYYGIERPYADRLRRAVRASLTGQGAPEPQPGTAVRPPSVRPRTEPRPLGGAEAAPVRRTAEVHTAAAGT
jgi:peptidoglycan/LPS O-acetylase OafA/YrhL